MAEPKVWTGCENLARKCHAIGVACSKHRQAPAEETAVGKEPIEECQYPDVTWRMVQGYRQAPNQKSVDIVSPWLSTRCCQWFSKFSIILSAVFQQRFSFVVHQCFSVVFHQKFSMGFPIRVFHGFPPGCVHGFPPKIMLHDVPPFFSVPLTRCFHGFPPMLFHGFPPGILRSFPTTSFPQFAKEFEYPEVTRLSVNSLPHRITHRIPHKFPPRYFISPVSRNKGPLMVVINGYKEHIAVINPLIHIYSLCATVLRFTFLVFPAIVLKHLGVPRVLSK